MAGAGCTAACLRDREPKTGVDEVSTLSAEGAQRGLRGSEKSVMSGWGLTSELTAVIRGVLSLLRIVVWTECLRLVVRDQKYARMRASWTSSTNATKHRGG